MTRHLPLLIPLILLTAALLAPLVGLVRHTWAYRLALFAIAADAGVALWGLAELHYGSGGRSHSSTEVVAYFERAGFDAVENVDFVAGTLTRTVGHKPGGSMP